MGSSFRRTAFVLAAMLVAAGCNETIEDIAPKAEKQLPEKIVNVMKAKGMSRSAPIMVRLFKEEGVLEIWKQKATGRYDLVTSYPICKWSGELGPKFREGDRQAPEGFYTVRPAQMNPNSSYYLSFNIGFPNAYDRAHGRTGANLMVHGACSSSGCYSMNDAEVAQIYAFARDAFRGGQEAFQIQAFPFRMTAANMARYRNDPNFAFWKMLKEGYDHFEITHLPPKVDVCSGRYVFNQTAAEGGKFVATAACPPMAQPPSLVAAYASFQKTYDEAFAQAVKAGRGEAPKPSIAGMKEANLVAAWSQARARGEKVTRLPPSFEQMAVAAATPAKAPVVAPKAEPEASAVAKAAPQPAAAPKVEPQPVSVASAAAQPAAKPAAAPETAPEAASAAPSAANAMAPVEQPDASKKWRIWKKIFGS